jgi:dipeptidyl aminopeptidase/acylaminoacyl peptidase
VALALPCAVVALRAGAQHPAPFTLDQVLNYPFPENLTAARAGNHVAWTFNERGSRNIYLADAPDFKAQKITAYDQDDGQELTNLSFSDDGRTIVYVRGGDHGSNWPAEGNLEPDPTGSPLQTKMQVWAVPTAGGAPKLLGDGDEPAIAPKSDRVAFVRDKRIWIAPIDGSKPAEAVFAKGSSRSPVWSPDGRTLAFVSDRGDHSFIALFTGPDQPLKYVAPSTSRDSMPAWSPDGGRIAFVRQPGQGGVPTLKPQPQPWALYVAEVQSGSAREVWKSGTAPKDSYPRIAGSMTPDWGAGDRLVFMSYADGWPHLYSVSSSGGSAVLLTPGNFMVEHAALTPDRQSIVYSANTGSDKLDVDRRHLFKVRVDAPSPVAPLTSGASIEWTPVVTSDGRFVVSLGSDAQRPPLPTAVPFNGGEARRIAADRVPSDFPAGELLTPQQAVFTSSDGLEIHGQVFKAAAGPARRPALVYVHGGPPRQMLLGWHYMGYYANDYGANQYLASRGFIVLSVNYRLGIGYGYAFHQPENAGARGASEYLDVLAGAKYLQGRPDVDTSRIGIWGGSYGGYLTALALGRNSDIFAAGVDIHGVHNWDRQGRNNAPNVNAALAGDGITMDDLQRVARVTYESSPISAVKTWRSPVLLIHADDDRNVDFHQTVDLKQRLLEQGVVVEELVIPDDIHDFLLWRTWRTVAGATAAYLEKKLLNVNGSAEVPGRLKPATTRR